MIVTCGAASAEPLAVASVFPVAAAPAPGFASVRASNVVKGSWCSLGSGLPRRSRGRFGSAICSSVAEADAGADVFAVSAGAGALAVSGAAGEVVVGVAGGGLLVAVVVAGGAGVLAGAPVDGAVAGVAGFCLSLIHI